MLLRKTRRHIHPLYKTAVKVRKFKKTRARARPSTKGYIPTMTGFRISTESEGYLRGLCRECLMRRASTRATERKRLTGSKSLPAYYAPILILHKRGCWMNTRSRERQKDRGSLNWENFSPVVHARARARGCDSARRRRRRNMCCLPVVFVFMRGGRKRALLKFP